MGILPWHGLLALLRPPRPWPFAVGPADEHLYCKEKEKESFIAGLQAYLHAITTKPPPLLWRFVWSSLTLSPGHNSRDEAQGILLTFPRVRPKRDNEK